MIIIPFPIEHDAEALARDRKVYAFLDSLPPMEEGGPASRLLEGGVNLIFCRDEDALAFRLKFGL